MKRCIFYFSVLIILMNITWSNVIDKFQTPETMFNTYNQYTNKDEYYNMITDWARYQKIQAIYNYPQAYHTYNNNPTTVHIIYLIFVYWLLDNILIKPFFKKARWFILHTIANIFVVYYAWNDLFHLLENPIMAFNRVPHYEALNITVALHFYHALFFKNLVFIDWVHHILMISIAIMSYHCPSSVIIATNGLLFFLNGLPGGIDYFLLTLVKYELIHPIQEKKLNSYLNIWIRSPGTLISAYNMYLTTVYANYYPSFRVKTLTMVILIWNAQYFTYRVVGNYFTKLTKKCVEFENREGRPLSTKDAKNCIDSKNSITEMNVIEEMSDTEEDPISKIINHPGTNDEDD